MAVDLHTHSEEPDGTDSPAELIRLANEAGLSAIALTDHDTLSGIEEARAAAGSAGPRLVAGVELSVDHDNVKIHLLAYFLEPGTGPLQDRLAELRAGRRRRNVEILARLRELGYDIEEHDVAAQTAGEAVGRPHIADALVARGWSVLHIASDDPAAASQHTLRSFARAAGSTITYPPPEVEPDGQGLLWGRLEGLEA